VASLAGEAALGARLRPQALERDLRAAVDAFAVGAVGYALERGSQQAQLSEVARDLRFGHVGEQVGDRFIAEVRRRPRDARVGSARTRSTSLRISSSSWLRRVVSAYASSIICLRLSAIVNLLGSRIGRAAAALLIGIKFACAARHTLAAMDSHLRHSRRTVLSRLAAALGAAFLPALPAPAATPRAVVHMSPSCGCCGEWVKHLRANGFQVEASYVDDILAVKHAHRVPQPLWSCHTALVEGYAIEGHVPAADIVRLLRERPRVNGAPASGLAVPGMPVGAPGMEQGATQPYATLAFGPQGTQVFARH
jgi:hypothetical protein